MTGRGERKSSKWKGKLRVAHSRENPRYFKSKRGCFHFRFAGWTLWIFFSFREDSICVFINKHRAFHGDSLWILVFFHVFWKTCSCCETLFGNPSSQEYSRQEHGASRKTWILECENLWTFSRLPGTLNKKNEGNLDPVSPKVIWSINHNQKNGAALVFQDLSFHRIYIASLTDVRRRRRREKRNKLEARTEQRTVQDWSAFTARTRNLFAFHKASMLPEEKLPPKVVFKICCFLRRFLRFLGSYKMHRIYLLTCQTKSSKTSFSLFPF